MTVLRVAQIVRETEAEGPGRRFGVWVQGCPIRCAGCCNPHMFDAALGTPADPSALAREAAELGVEGITLLGGEPFAQAEACAAFAAGARASGLGVMVFTGYELAALRAWAGNAPGVAALLASTDLLVDGPYDRDEPEPARRWIGSKNQQMHFLTDRYPPDAPCFRERNTVELRLGRSELTVNGWPAASRVLRRGA